MARYFPILLGVALIVGLTIAQIQMTDRLSGSNVSAAQRAELLKKVPMDFGDWHGEDKPVDEKVRETAGAVGAVSRTYRNTRTGEKVDLWLIVGHAREVSFHTPDACYPASGFETRGKENALYPLSVPGLPDTPFWTNTFFKEDEVTGRGVIRVFWSWYNPESTENQGKVVWEAPPNARWHFGNTRSLYKMYFTSEMRDAMETAEQSACLHFARDFLPELDKALSEVHYMPHEGAAATPGTEQPAADPATKVISPNEIYHTLGAGEQAPLPSDTAKPEAAAGETKDAAATNAPAPADPAKNVPAEKAQEPAAPAAAEPGKP